MTQFTVSPHVTDLFVAAALGLLLGLEREWSEKSAGIRTFTLTSLIGAGAASIGSTGLLVLGGGLVLVQSLLLGTRGLLSTIDSTGPSDGLALTTSTSLLVAYTAGIVVGRGRLLLGVVIAITGSFLLVLRRELHSFAQELSHEEIRSAAEFAIIAFVVYPLLPTDSYGPWGAVDLRLIWTLVIAVSAMGFVNYVLMQRYGGRGLVLTGFFGGLVNSTAVIGEIAGRVERHPGLSGVAVGTILLADAAMAVRNAIIVLLFLPDAFVSALLPLGCIAVGGTGIALAGGGWQRELDVDFDSPFSTANALKFGLLFVVVLVLSAGAQAEFGTAGFLLTSFLSGVVSSGTTTTTAVTLATTGQVSPTVAVQGVLIGTFASILVKVGLAASIDRALLRPVFVRSLCLVAFGAAGIAVSLSVF
ncbi:MgtC/SapB family protein [Haloarcula litorea]|uniref:MgtC/SapB family protein n=1 Tax=Haloarcula litorea TaxID=3032579 RepID=UPI0023E84AF3|nr:DUF4010 domain-containing protein [Halomicroarcula sp. GDY20]